MNKQELLAKIAEESGLNKTKVESVLKSLAATAKDEVVTKGEFTLQDICKIKTSIRKAGERRNPGTGQVFHSPEKKSSKNYAGEIFKRCSALTQNIPSVGLGWI